MASFQGNLYVGLGNGANNAELWRWDGNSWTIIAGNTVGSSWGSNYEEVDALATDGQYLYAGLGNSAQDGDVWRYDGSAWQKIGGDSLNGGWTTGNNIYNIYSLAVYKGKLIAGLGRTAGQGQAWSWNGSAWTKIGGNGVNGSWDSAGNNTESVESLITYNGRLYAGLGATTGDGAVWEYDDASWQKVGGDELNGSWVSGTYERVKTLSVYNGDLYAGLGSTASHGEGQPRDVITFSVDKKLLNGEVRREIVQEKTGSTKGKLIPTPSGEVLSDFLNEHFNQVVDYGWTADLHRRPFRRIRGPERCQ
jgi:hypothetical protein